MTKLRLTPGFTLIEIILVITITGIIARIVSTFITTPVQGYVDSVKRAELTDSADVALRRLTRDLRLALPNSLRILTSGGTNYIEFIMTSAGGRYRADGDGSTGGNSVSFTDSTQKSFDVLGAMPANPAVVAGVDYIVIYNLGSPYSPADAYNFDASTGACRGGGCNIAPVSSFVGNTITLGANPFASQSPPLPSPSARFQVVPGGTKAVTFSCPTTVAGNLNRYANYGFASSQSPPGGTPALLAQNVTCTTEYTTNATGRSGVLLLTLTVKDPTNGESVTLFNQVLIDNSP